MKQEPFGPLVPILSFKDFDEVMDRANKNDLGLCSYVYTTDLKKANKVLISGKIFLDKADILIIPSFIPSNRKGSSFNNSVRY